MARPLGAPDMSLPGDVRVVGKVLLIDRRVALAPVGPEQVILEANDHAPVRAKGPSCRFNDEHTHCIGRVDIDPLAFIQDQAAVAVPEATGRLGVGVGDLAQLDQLVGRRWEGSVHVCRSGWRRIDDGPDWWAEELAGRVGQRQSLALGGGLVGDKVDGNRRFGAGRGRGCGHGSRCIQPFAGGVNQLIAGAPGRGARVAQHPLLDEAFARFEDRVIFHVIRVAHVGSVVNAGRNGLDFGGSAGGRCRLAANRGRLAAAWFAGRWHRLIPTLVGGAAWRVRWKVTRNEWW